MARSRLMSVKEKREFRQAILLIVITLILLVGFVFWGLPAVAQFVGDNLIKSGETSQEIEIRPTSPILIDIPESSKEDEIAVAGYSQPGLEVSLFVNTEQKGQIIVTESGEFSFPKIRLSDEKNEIYAFAYNQTSKLESDKSKTHYVTVDTTAPTVTLSEPSNESVYRTESERVITVSGSVDEESVKVYIAERLAIVSTDLTFNMSYQLVEGEQEIVVKAIDKAGNETTETRRVRWER